MLFFCVTLLDVVCSLTFSEHETRTGCGVHSEFFVVRQRNDIDEATNSRSPMYGCNGPSSALIWDASMVSVCCPVFGLPRRFPTLVRIHSISSSRSMSRNRHFHLSLFAREFTEVLNSSDRLVKHLHWVSGKDFSLVECWGRRFVSFVVGRFRRSFDRSFVQGSVIPSGLRSQPGPIDFLRLGSKRQRVVLHALVVREALLCLSSLETHVLSSPRDFVIGMLWQGMVFNVPCAVPTGTSSFSRLRCRRTEIRRHKAHDRTKATTRTRTRRCSTITGVQGSSGSGPWMVDLDGVACHCAGSRATGIASLPVGRPSWDRNYASWKHRQD